MMLVKLGRFLRFSTHTTYTAFVETCLLFKVVIYLQNIQETACKTGVNENTGFVSRLGGNRIKRGMANLALTMECI